MEGDITIYIAPCTTNENRKKYNSNILGVMEESKLEYTPYIPSNRMHGLIKLEVDLKDEAIKRYEPIARNLKSKLEHFGIDVKRVVDFRGKPLV